MDSHKKQIIHNIKTPLSTIDIAINTTLDLISESPELSSSTVTTIRKLLNNANIATLEIHNELKEMLMAFQGEK